MTVYRGGVMKSKHKGPGREQAPFRPIKPAPTYSSIRTLVHSRCILDAREDKEKMYSSRTNAVAADVYADGMFYGL